MSTSKRGLSRDEKKAKMLELFHENSEFFTLKELEKIAPKQKGIVQQTVKEILEELVSDNEVVAEKIGTSNYFWSFPSAAGATKQAALAKAQRELEEVTSKIAEVNAGLKAAEKDREDTPERRKLLSTLSDLQAENKTLKDELAAFGAADPARHERKMQAVEVCKEAALRWTDNTIVLLQYAAGLGVEPDTIRQELGITEEWEDLQI
ncbi:meiotic nuclear division protein 1 [Kockovaella imperatae]|uniref:Meiotic nuclear division protein 1 n=1 Tax=Kockovaella imperatae TaxID=4999 RepID=A0A1Y1UBB4_9TREE|nr:meiotic nuclear division protein 1 [Kockovaella imperatae]ORX35302.1 meiotic nuclear division protein 1 [Kockovaella imperatae]